MPYTAGFYANVLVPFDFGVVYIYIVIFYMTNLVLVPFDFGVVYIHKVYNPTTFFVLVPFDFGVVYITYKIRVDKL